MTRIAVGWGRPVEAARYRTRSCGMESLVMVYFYSIVHRFANLLPGSGQETRASSTHDGHNSEERGRM
jgi:hypothetical protein